MTSLAIRDFSCIDEAVLELSRLTLITGPQASGKSVLSKLTYFFVGLVGRHTAGFQPDTDFDAFQQHIDQEFRRWFPRSAWGNKKFSIDFQMGEIAISIVRKKAYRKPSNDFHLTISDNLKSHYEAVAEQALLAREAAATQKTPSSIFEALWRVRRQARDSLAELVGTEFIDYQMFVPAGRAFFTSVGKAIAVFEQSGFLDPATVDFGRYWASVRDSRYIDIDEYETTQPKDDLMVEIFGGRLRRERDLEYVESTDGRKVPMTALSSGQQELLPLWITLQRFFADVSTDEPSKGDQSLMYIEEPEAHLFPHAQSKLIQYLVNRLYAGQNAKHAMMLTTHSPYVLSKLNNLIKASNVARASREKAQEVARILPRQSWLRANHVKAYAIVDRKLVPIQERDGIINASYIDAVSAEIMDEFSDLLDVECANADPC